MLLMVLVLLFLSAAIDIVAVVVPRINTDGMQYETGSGFWHKSSYRIMRESSASKHVYSFALWFAVRKHVDVFNFISMILKQEINLYKRNQECLEKNNSFMYVQFIASN
ncbi:hypothetical protein GQX74_009330 [Glossina fuscipes]|nr:hypothetical protein GQX74_009330 [Glossina fuscipes]